VSDTSRLLLADARLSLLRTVQRRPQPDLAVLFADWIMAGSVNRAEAELITKATCQRTGAQLDFQTVAALGYAGDSGISEPAITGALQQGLERLAGRQPFVDGNPMSFCSDAAGILGVALGSKFLADNAISEKVAAWLASFLGTIYALEGTEDWQRHLFCAANGILGGRTNLTPPSPQRAADAFLALVARNIFVPADGGDAEQAEQQALQLILSEAALELPFERAAVRLSSLHQVIRTAPVVVPGRMDVPALIHLLERVPAGLRSWTWESKPRTLNAQARRWHIDNEYHVQNLLWAILAPIFPDLDDEQYLTKIGQKNPRADFYIPSMKIIVEAKFLRVGDRVQKIIDEISSDASLYGALGNDCAGIIPFIWDDSARSQEHDYLKQGLKKLSGVLGTIIVSRPSDWTEAATEANNSEASAAGKTSRTKPSNPRKTK
jgi:hypothetical protein